jgi:glutaminyl-peptide cyclotransferase
MKKGLSITYLACLPLLFACNGGDEDDPPVVENKVQQISYTVKDTLPHDTSAFTQGLEFYKGYLMEGTGNYGHSRLFRKELQTGKVIKEVKLDTAHFGEGISILRDTLYQLTWREKVVHVYSAGDMKKIGQQTITTEGWGISNDGQYLIVSDGSNTLNFYNSKFQLHHSISVSENGSPAVNLNELEYIKGFIYANQWQYNYILKINPANGEVVGKLDLTDLANRARAKNPAEQFLNGIAYNAETDKIYVTGKYWPELYEISFTH